VLCDARILNIFEGAGRNPGTSDREVNLVDAGPLVTRQFTSPSLAAFDIASETNPVFSKYKVRPKFCPYQLAPHALGDLIEQIALVCAKLDSSNRRDKTLAA
jgi:hypothetical protein